MKNVRTRRLCLSIIVGLAIVSAAMVGAQGADPMSGTWKLNVAKSKFSPGPAPKSQTLNISGSDQARKLVVDATPATGPDQHWEVAGASGTDLKVTGNNPNADTYVFTRVNATTLEAQIQEGRQAYGQAGRGRVGRRQDAHRHRHRHGRLGKSDKQRGGVRAVTASFSY